MRVAHAINTVREQARKLIRAVWWFARWSTVWAWRPFWSIVLPPLALVMVAPWLALQWRADDAVTTGIQIAGVAIQIAGMWLIVRGVLRILHHTDRPGVFKQWLCSIRPRSISAGGSMATVGVAASGRGRVKLGPGKSVDDRLVYLEREIDTLHDLIGKVESTATAERRERIQQIGEVRSEIGDQRRHFEGALADDYYTEVHGLWWIGAGILLAAFPGFFAPAWHCAASLIAKACGSVFGT